MGPRAVLFCAAMMVVVVEGAGTAGAGVRSSARPPRTTPALSPQLTRNLTALANRSGTRNRYVEIGFVLEAGLRIVAVGSGPRDGCRVFSGLCDFD